MTIDGLIGIAGIVVPVASLAASLLNQRIRGAQADGKAVDAWVLKVAAVLNVIALNGDKALQAAKLAKGKK